MSLVAYASSSDDESGGYGNVESLPPNIKTPQSDGEISDEVIFPVSIKKAIHVRKTLALPVPKLEGEECDSIVPLFGKLPLPKSNQREKIQLIEEEDDEFLRKKATPLETPEQKVLPVKNLVRITIPSLKDFDDVQERKTKNTDVGAKTSAFSSLMSILPVPKSEQSFVKTKTSNNASDGNLLTKKIILVPDTVKNRRPAQNTEHTDRKLLKKGSPKSKQKDSLVYMTDSDGSDNNEDLDFFSLQSENKLPEVNADEIAAMVSKRAAHMTQVSSNFVSVLESNKPKVETEEPDTSTISNSQQQLDEEAIQALIGSQAKRRKMDGFQVIDISSDQVLPNKDEWLRTALASATTYQATGVLTDEEPAAGTRRKHQITYLAHKAKANEAELQAMWSANRQNRRQTQSKYGF